MAARKHKISDEQREAAEAEIVDRSRRIDFYTTEYTVEILADRRMAQTHTDMAAETRLRKAIVLCDYLVASLPIEAFDIEKGGGGNWDDEEIWRMAQRLGVALNLSRSAKAGVKRAVRDDLGAMKLIVSLRNKLAHGSLSFAECGQYDTAAELRQIAARVAAYMREVVNAFSLYIQTHGYLRPESRPAATA